MSKYLYLNQLKLYLFFLLYQVDKINDHNDQKLIIEKVIQLRVEKLRMNISFEVINNEIEQENFYKLIKVHSYEADLIMMSLPEIIEGVEQKYVKTTNELLDVMGTILILKASSPFTAEEVIDPDLEKNYLIL